MGLIALQLRGWVDSDNLIDTAGSDHVAGQPAVLTSSGWRLATAPANVLGVFKNDMAASILAAPQAADARVATLTKGAVLMGLNKIALSVGKLKDKTTRTPFALPPTGGGGVWAQGDHLYVSATGLWDNAPATPDDPPFGIVTVAPASATDTLEAVTSSMSGFRGISDLSSLASANQEIVAAGATAISLTAPTTRADGNAAGDNITSTLADGLFAGQRKWLVLSDITAAKTWVVTPTHFQDGTSITLASPLDSALVEWSAALGKWFTVALTGNASVS